MRQSRHGLRAGRRWLVTGLACALALALLDGPTPQAQPGAGVASPPADPIALKAFQALDKHCARCHEAGGKAKPDGRLGAILDLARLARDPHLVQPGNPDGSRLYTSMLMRRMPPAAHGGEDKAASVPSVEDIGAIRDWIAALPRATASACPERAPVGADAIRASIEADRAKAAPERAAQARYISLAPLWNACAGFEELAQARRALGVTLAGLSLAATPVGLEPADETWKLLKIHLDDLAWPVEAWARLAAVDPYGDGTASGALRGDWLAYLASETGYRRKRTLADPPEAVRGAIEALDVGERGLARLRRTDPSRFLEALRAGGLDVESASFGVPMREVLARRYESDLDLLGAAAELGVTPQQLAQRLADAPHGIAAEIAARLAQGTIPRRVLEIAFDALEALAHGRAREPKPPAVLGLSTLPPGAPAIGQPFEIEIAADKASYERGQHVTVTISAPVECHLTLISVDAKGVALVLAPNDFDQSVVVRPGQPLRFPREGAPYRLRLSEAGSESLIAGCNASGTGFDGIRHDFNLQKFTELGDWRSFVARTFAGEPAPKPEGRVARRPRHRQQPVVSPQNAKPGAIARTAVRLEVR